MFRLIFLSAAMLSSIFCSAQFTLRGHVRDQESKQSIPGSVVQLTDQLVTTTDEFGSFTFRNIQAGNYLIKVSSIAHNSAEQTVMLDADKTVEINLVSKPIVTEEVVISATRASDKTPTTHSSLSREKIQKQNFGQDLPFLLNWTPSVVTTSDAGTGVGYTGIRIRGSDATRVNVTINGIPYNDSESQGTFWVDIPDIASSSQSIQIQRGVGSSTNGAGAFGGTINLQTTTRNDKAYAELINTAGFFRSSENEFFENVKTLRHTLSLGSGLLKDHWIFDARISKITSAGFIDRADADLSSYYLSGAWHSDKTVIKAIAFGGKERTYQSWYGVPESKLNSDVDAMMVTAINEGWNDEQTTNLLNSDSRTFNQYLYEDQVDDYRQNHYQLHFSNRINDKLSVSVSPHYTRGKGYYEEFKYDDDFASYNLAPVVAGPDLIESSDLVRRRWLDNHFYGVTYSLNIDQSAWNLIIGGGSNRYDGDHFGEVIWTEAGNVPPVHRYYFNSGIKNDHNIFAKANFDLTEKLNFYADLQLRSISFSASGLESKLNNFNIDTNFSFFNPKAGITYAFSPQSHLYASYAQGNREPVRDDFVDNPGTAPKPERLHNIEIGIKRTSTKYAFSANYYLMSYRDQLVLTGQVNDVGASIRTNVDKSYRMGIELEAAMKLSDRLLWNANLTLSRNRMERFTETLYDYGANFDEYNPVQREYTDTDISFSPNVIAGSSFSFIPHHRFEITLLSKFVGKQYLDNTSNDDRSIDPYFVNDLRMSYRIKPRTLKAVDISLLVNNIFNEIYESNGYTWGYLGGGEEYRENYYFPQVGTNIMLMLTIKL